ncbi:MAG: hypothetical protein ABSF83_01625 [Nitrososphaerales archaeon]
MEATTESCRWLHEQLEFLGRAFRYGFSPESLPRNGIYFFYEDGETWGHGGDARPHIVRIGTHRDGNFRSRMSEHFLLNESSAMDFDEKRSRPHDRSIFRKNIGRALLARDGDPYLEVWNSDLIKDANKERYRALRDVQKEKRLESEVTKILRKQFSFRFLVVADEAARMGKSGLESRLIGTVAQCGKCKPSSNWLGLHSPEKRIREGRLWQVQHLNSPPISDADRERIESAVAATMEWSKSSR